MSRLHCQRLYGRKKSTTVIILIIKHCDSDIQCTPACMYKIHRSHTHNTLYAFTTDLHALWCGHKLHPHHTLPITPKFLGRTLTAQMAETASPLVCNHRALPKPNPVTVTSKFEGHVSWPNYLYYSLELHQVSAVFDRFQYSQWTTSTTNANAQTINTSNIMWK